MPVKEHAYVGKAKMAAMIQMFILLPLIFLITIFTNSAQ